MNLVCVRPGKTRKESTTQGAGRLVSTRESADWTGGHAPIKNAFNVFEDRVMRRLTNLVLALLLCLCGTPGLMAGVVLQPTPAPDWEVSAWLNDDPGSLRDYRGRVVLIEFVQVLCPGSNDFLVPLFQRWQELYGEREDVLIVSIHSVFEEHDYQTPQRLQEFVRANGIRHPVGIDAYDDVDDRVPVTMRRYQTGGTPHIALVDREGKLRFSHFGTFDAAPVEAFIERLLQEPLRTFAQASETTPLRERARPTLDARLSGTYVFRINQATGVCAGWIPRMEVPAELRVRGEEIDVEFRVPFLGMDEMMISYDPRTGHVEGVAGPRARVTGGAVSPQRLRLDGVLDAQSNPPRLEFELSMLEGKCALQGRARQ